MYTKILNHLRDLSAEEDSNFSRHFISTRYNKRILSDHSDIIFGTKGTGKTALSIALTEFDKDNFLNTYILDLNTLSFQRLLNNLKELEEMINEDINIISRIAWKNTLLNAAILSLSEKLNNDEDLKFKIISILNEDGFIQNSSDRKDSDEKVNSILENLFSKITNAIFVKKGISNLSSSQVNAINKFPLNEKTSKILNTIIEKVFSTGKKILVTIDGLDSISDHSFESRNVIFTGLIDAIYHLRIDKNIKKAFVFKAFLPQELTIDAQIKIWDSDKHMHNTHYINWDKKSLKEFIRKRFAAVPIKNRTTFEDLWNEYLPEKLINPIYGVEENCFEYILRHTLYRPRQVQNQIFTIIQRWIEINDSNDKIQGNFIPKVIASNNVELAKQVVEKQLSKIYTNIIPFFKSWRNSPTYIKVSEFKDKIDKYLIEGRSNLKTYQTIDKLFDELYIFGIFGIALDKKNHDFRTKTKDFHFSFVNDSIVTSIYSTVEDDDLIAFSPMFREYCGLQRQNKYIISPVKQNEY